MTTNTVLAPRFCQGQCVEFLGGTGTIVNYRPDSGTWSYLVEMEMGPEPNMGRVGNETMLWLPEMEVSLL